MTWWCAATGVPWTGEWRAYPGVWMFVAAIAVGFWRWGRVGDHHANRYFTIGVVLLWLALDWPLGALGGYLASAHAGQFIILSLAAPPFLLLGLRPRLARVSPPRGVLAFLARPLPAFLGYNLIVIATHFPGVVDQLMASQLGSFLLDLLWLGAGGMLWWPVAAPAEYLRLTPPLQMGYLFVQTIPATLPAAFLIFADYPLYRLYELSPRVSEHLTPGYDHQVAGLLMKIVGDPLVWIGIAVIFFRWANAEQRRDLASKEPIR